MNIFIVEAYGPSSWLLLLGTPGGWRVVEGHQKDLSFWCLGGGWSVWCGLFTGRIWHLACCPRPAVRSYQKLNVYFTHKYFPTHRIISHLPKLTPSLLPQACGNTSYTNRSEGSSLHLNNNMSESSFILQNINVYQNKNTIAAPAHTPNGLILLMPKYYNTGSTHKA